MIQEDVIIKYADIIDYSYPFPTDIPRMPLWKRAAQFAPFSALKGLDDAYVKVEENIIAEYDK